MFDFIRKPEIWAALDEGLLKGTHQHSFHLKTMQDLFILQRLQGFKGATIGEVGGGASRVLPELARNNKCFNIEPFEGVGNGPQEEIRLPGVGNIRASVGKSQPSIDDATFDVLFSISVVEHVKNEDLQGFFDDCVRILKPGGVMYHAIDIYISARPSQFWQNRFQLYRNAVASRADAAPIGPVYNGTLTFSPDMASNPDIVMYRWRSLSPLLDDLRQHAQCVSLKAGLKRVV